jgi:hypothetical protein
MLRNVKSLRYLIKITLKLLFIFHPIKIKSLLIQHKKHKKK